MLILVDVTPGFWRDYKPKLRARIAAALLGASEHPRYPIDEYRFSLDYIRVSIDWRHGPIPYGLCEFETMLRGLIRSAVEKVEQL